VLNKNVLTQFKMRLFPVSAIYILNEAVMTTPPGFIIIIRGVILVIVLVVVVSLRIAFVPLSATYIPVFVESTIIAEIVPKDPVVKVPSVR